MVKSGEVEGVWDESLLWGCFFPVCDLVYGFGCFEGVGKAELVGVAKLECKCSVAVRVVQDVVGALSKNMWAQNVV